MHWIQTGNISKLSQALAKGMDPNFQDDETGGRSTYVMRRKLADELPSCNRHAIDSVLFQK